MTIRLLLTLPLALVATAVSAQTDDRGPGIAGERRGDSVAYPASGFDEVSLGGNATVEVRVGPAFSVVARGPAAAFARFRVATDGNRLEIGRRYRRNDDSADRAITVVVTLPRIAGASVGGAGRMRVDRVTGDRFRGSVGGSGRLSIAGLSVARAELSVGGSGGIEAAGQARALTASVGGSGQVDAPRLRAAQAQVSVGGSGHVTAAVDGPATVSIAGSGSVDLGAGARCKTSKVGSGSVRCGG